MITLNSYEVSEQLKMKYELYFPKFSYKISFFLPNPTQGRRYVKYNKYLLHT